MYYCPKASGNNPYGRIRCMIKNIENNYPVKINNEGNKLEALSKLRKPPEKETLQAVLYSKERC